MRKKPKLIVAAHRVAEARRIVANLNDRITEYWTTYARSRASAGNVTSVRLSTSRIRSAELEKKTRPKSAKLKKEIDASEIGHQLQKISNRSLDAIPRPTEADQGRGRPQGGELRRAPVLLRISLHLPYTAPSIEPIVETEATL